MESNPIHAHANPRRRLIIRLSSLGDVILATAALAEDATVVDWVVAKEFAPVLRGHPRINRIWEFDRRGGLPAWVALCRELRAQKYDEILDLHRSVRSVLAQILFLCWSVASFDQSRVQWRAIQKSRWRLWGYFLLKKKHWPADLRPASWANRFSNLTENSRGVLHRPDMTHLLGLPGEVERVLGEIGVKRGDYFCVMPDSNWSGKNWPIVRFVQALKELDVPIVVLGTDKDQRSHDLLGALELAGKNAISAVGRLDLQGVARLLSASRGLLSNDTGMVHLAEAVGVRAVVVYGPTTPDMGFGPWREQSRALEGNLWCRPCGKDGRFCFRTGEDRFRCLNTVDPREVSRALLESGVNNA
ncbi:MAG: glycosyltransferase family 9 protein [Bdellovibrionota bacterium]